MNPAAIELVGVEKRYDQSLVLDGIDLEVVAGETVCLLGPNGAGKTTTVEILEGFRTATRGFVRVLGYDPATRPPALRERVGIVLQECGFPQHLTVHEVLQAWTTYYSAPRSVAELMELVDLRSANHRLVRHLSGGQRRRLDFALALAGNPDVVFLDEPTTGFDPDARQRCWAAIENLRSLGKTILLTTHYLEEAERLADRVAILAGGRIQAYGTVRELASRSGLPSQIRVPLPKDLTTCALPDIAGVGRDGDHLLVRTQAPADALRALLHWARRHRLDDLSELAVTPPTLEDVYFTLASPHAGGFTP